jgi:hypothetical protein
MENYTIVDGYVTYAVQPSGFDKAIADADAKFKAKLAIAEYKQQAYSYACDWRAAINKIHADIFGDSSFILRVWGEDNVIDIIIRRTHNGFYTDDKSLYLLDIELTGIREPEGDKPCFGGFFPTHRAVGIQKVAESFDTPIKNAYFFGKERIQHVASVLASFKGAPRIW